MPLMCGLLFNNKTSTMAAEFFSIVKGGEFLVVDEYLYRLDRNILPIRRWKCKTHGCRATAMTDGGQLVRASDDHE